MRTWDVRFDLHVELGDLELRDLLARIHAEARLTAGIPLPPAARKRIDALHIVRAIRGTTGIEGAELTEKEVSDILAAPAAKPVLPSNRRREELEVRNAEAVMRHVAESADEPISEDLIRRLHVLVTEGIPYAHNVPGAYRSHSAQAGEYVPPRTSAEIRRLMREFVDRMNSREVQDWDPVIRAIAAHFYLISIHPFGDGNGRTARALESYVLYRGGINVVGFYSLANFYYQNRAKYVEVLDHVRFASGGDLTPFVLFAVEGLRDELKGVTEIVVDTVRNIAFRDYARECLLGADGPGGKVGTRQLILFNIILNTDEFRTSTARSISAELNRAYRGLTARTLQRDIAALLNLHLIAVDGSAVTANLGLMDLFTPKGIQQQSMTKRAHQDR